MAGSGKAGYRDGHTDTCAFSFPVATAVLPSGDILVADKENNCIRKISRDYSTIVTFAGARNWGHTNGTADEVLF